MPRVITFHYTLQDPEGETIDSSRDGAPMPFLEGVQQIVPGLEAELVTMQVGDKRKIVVPAERAYGPHHAQLVQTLPRADMPSPDIEVGDQFEAGDGDDTFVVTVTEVNDKEVTLDGNHPLAGQELHFDVEIMEVREATLEEMRHGHAHGPGGAHDH